MTEIKIEKKKPVWPWILLLLGIAALVYFLVFDEVDSGETQLEEAEIESTSMAVPSNDNQAYVLAS